MALATTVAGSASAAPNYAASLSHANAAFTWEDALTGGPTENGDLAFLNEEFGTPDPSACNAAAGPECHDVLLELKEPGDLKVEVAVADPESVPDPLGGNVVTVPDVDMYVYPSDAAGEVKGEQISENATAASAEQVEVANLPDLAAGFYLVRVKAFLAFDSAYTGTVSFVSDAPAPAPTPTETATPAPTAEPQPTATPQQQPQQQPQQASPQQQPAAQPQPSSAPAAKAPAKKKSSKRAACTKKAKKIKNKRKRAKALKRCKKVKG